MAKQGSSTRSPKRLRTSFVNGSPEAEMDWILALIEAEKESRRTGELPKVPPFSAIPRGQATGREKA